MASLKERAGFENNTNRNEYTDNPMSSEREKALIEISSYNNPDDRPAYKRIHKRIIGVPKTYDELLKEKEAGRGDNYTEAQWKYAWEKKQQEESKKAKPKEATDPTPLLMDKASSLPPGSNQRIASETTKGSIDNTTASAGTGLDNLTRESYKDTKRLVKNSEMLSEGVKQPMPSSSQLVGEEEGKKVSNLQSCNPAFANAVKPVSDAIGSHADVNSSVVKSPMGANQLMPTAATAAVDAISPQFSNEVDSCFKAVKVDEMQHLPSKSVGSIRNLATVADPTLAVPFEIASDVYNGLLGIMDEISNLIDGVMASITDFAIGIVGGLVDSIFPADLLANILGPVADIAGEVEGLNQLLGGFPALSNITNLIGGIAGSLSAVLSDPSKIAAALAGGANVAAIIGGLAGSSSGCAGNQLGMGSLMDAANDVPFSVDIPTSPIGGVIGSVGILGGGLGNLGAMIAGGISGNIGSLTSNIRNPAQLITGILPPELSQSLQMLDQVPGLGMVGNMGYSVGTAFDSLTDSSFSKCMNNYASHASIVSPLFNKQHESKGGYAQEPSVGLFQGSSFVKGAQGNKGVTMLGPGSTASQRTFPGSFAPVNGGPITVTDAEVMESLERGAQKNPAEAQAEIAALKAKTAKYQAIAAQARAQANS